MLVVCASCSVLCPCVRPLIGQVVIFVKSVSRADQLNKLLVECNFPAICIHSNMKQEER